MTRREFDELIAEAEKTAGKTFPETWKKSRFEAVKDATVESFRVNLLPTLIDPTGMIELDLESAKDSCNCFSR